MSSLFSEIEVVDQECYDVAMCSLWIAPTQVSFFVFNIHGSSLSFFHQLIIAVGFLIATVRLFYLPSPCINLLSSFNICSLDTLHLLALE